MRHGLWSLFIVVAVVVILVCAARVLAAAGGDDGSSHINLLVIVLVAVVPVVWKAAAWVQEIHKNVQSISKDLGALTTKVDNLPCCAHHQSERQDAE